MEFFNDLGRKFSQAVQTVQERTRDGVESTRISVDLRSARADLEKHLLELGRTYYESVENGGEVPAALVERVRDCMNLIEDLIAQRDRTRQQVRCAGCGAVHPEDARFCSNCGRPLPEKSPELPAQMDDPEYCSACGAMRRGHARYCAICGADFENEEALPALISSEKEAAEALEEPDSADLYAE